MITKNLVSKKVLILLIALIVLITPTTSFAVNITPEDTDNEGNYLLTEEEIIAIAIRIDDLEEGLSLKSKEIAKLEQLSQNLKDQLKVKDNMIEELKSINTDLRTDIDELIKLANKQTEYADKTIELQEEKAELLQRRSNIPILQALGLVGAGVLVGTIF